MGNFLNSQSVKQFTNEEFVETLGFFTGFIWTQNSVGEFVAYPLSSIMFGLLDGYVISKIAPVMLNYLPENAQIILPVALLSSSLYYMTVAFMN